MKKNGQFLPATQGVIRDSVPRWFFLFVLLLFAAAASHAQSYSAPYFYTINPENTVTITGYYQAGFVGAVTIPDTIDGYLVTGIGGDGFYGCGNVTSITVPSSVTNIAADVFENAINLMTINVATNNPAYMDLAGVLFNKTETEIIAFPEGNVVTSYTIPGTVTNIDADAFSLCHNLIGVTIPSGVTSIPDGEFGSSTHLAGVVIPGSVTSVGEGAFGATGLTNLTISDNVTNIGDLAFSDCRSLTNITIGDGVPSIANSTFQYSGLTSITIPDSVTNIGNYAFWYSSNLASVTIGNGVTNIGIQVFSYCPGLAAINVATDNPAFTSANGILFDKGQSALLQYPQGNPATSYSVPNSVADIGSWAFLDSTNVDSVTIDNSVTNIGYEAFCFCASLTNITIPDSVISIQGEAFSDCSNLASVIIGNNVGSITYATFADCGSLDSVIIGSGVTNIGEIAFYDAGLTNLTIPASVTSIDDLAFAGCASLAGVFFEGNAPSIAGSPFLSDNVATVYYLPGTTGWSSNFAGLPAVLWNPLIQTANGGLGLNNHQFQFNIRGTANIPIVVEACTNLANPAWISLTNVALTNGLFSFTDSGRTNYASRYYRIAAP